MSETPNPHNRRRPIPLLIAAGLSIGNLFLHKPISDVCDALYARVGRSWYESISIALIGALCAIASIPALRRLRGALATTWLPVSLVGLALLTIASQHWLLVTNIELIHFPQFAFIAGLFLVAGAGPKLAWLLGSLAGLLDETYQHLVLYAGVPNTYFDINDILLNAIGAAWGVCLFGARGLAASGPLFPNPRRYAVPAVLVLSVVALSVYWDPPDQTFLRPAATRRLYRVLSLGEGLFGIGVVLALIELAAWPRRSRPTASNHPDSQPIRDV